MSKFLLKEFRLPEHSLVRGYTMEDLAQEGAPTLDKAYREFTVNGERRVMFPAGPEHDD